jgi:hypothetical protein
MEVSGQLHAHWIGGWVDSRNGVGILKKQSLAPAGNQNLVPQLYSLLPSCYTDRTARLPVTKVFHQMVAYVFS